jgi:hypothetical protein
MICAVIFFGFKLFKGMELFPFLEETWLVSLLNSKNLTAFSGVYFP